MHENHQRSSEGDTRRTRIITFFSRRSLRHHFSHIFSTKGSTVISKQYRLSKRRFVAKKYTNCHFQFSSDFSAKIHLVSVHENKCKPPLLRAVLSYDFSFLRNIQIQTSNQAIIHRGHPAEDRRTLSFIPSSLNNQRPPFSFHRKENSRSAHPPFSTTFNFLLVRRNIPPVLTSNHTLCHDGR